VGGGGQGGVERFQAKERAALHTTAVLWLDSNSSKGKMPSFCVVGCVVRGGGARGGGGVERFQAKERAAL
jgi:hypothetical protein